MCSATPPSPPGEGETFRRHHAGPPSMKTGVIIFPGINRERDMMIALRRSGGEPRMIWHKETDLAGLDLIVLPGGFSHGDYLRCGAMAAHSPVMAAVRGHVARGGYLLGVCNGFQILTEAGLLPGALLRNASLRFLSMDCHLRVERTDTVFTSQYQRGQVFRAVMAHGDGNYFADEATLDRLEGEGLVALRYATPSGDVNTGSQPQRQCTLHRRHPLAKPARARTDAAPRGPCGSADGRHRRQAAVRRVGRGVAPRGRSGRRRCADRGALRPPVYLTCPPR